MKQQFIKPYIVMKLCAINYGLLNIIKRYFKNSNYKLSNLYEKIKKVIEIKNPYFLTVILTDFATLL